jgi:alkylation response protein AidB-like acyl-CoA dehydrogenase
VTDRLFLRLDEVLGIRADQIRSAGSRSARPARDARAGALEAQQVLGGYGYLRDMPVEKRVRDACVGPIYDSTDDMLKVNQILPTLAFPPGL